MAPPELSPQQKQVLQVLAHALLAAAMLVLLGGYLLGRREPGDVPALAAVAAGWAGLSVVLAIMVGDALLMHARTPEAQLTARILPLALLESGVIVCGIALLLSGQEYPVLAAMVPLALMMQRVIATQS